MPKSSRPVKSVVLVGQAPSRNAWSGNRRLIPLTGTVSTVAFRGTCGWFIADLAGVGLDRLHELADTVNLMDAFPGRRGEKGDAFDIEAMARRAAALTPRLRGRRVCLFGRPVAEAFGLDLPFLSEVERCGVRFFTFSHPSAINRWWNKPSNKRAAASLLKRALFGGDDAEVQPAQG
jgi:uracil-DNA glycosylase